MPSSLTTNTAASNRLRKRLKSCCISSALLFACSLAIAAEDIPPPPKEGEKTTESQPQAVQPPPALPPEDTASDDSREIPQPEVTIIHQKEATIEEYRVNGRLRYVKITPTKGKPYYLVDKDGDGTLETRYSDLKGTPPVNEWILLEW
jgi:hypothetical protein